MQIVFLLATVVCLVAQARDDEEDLFKRYAAAIAQGRDEEALSLANKAVSLAPKNPRAYLARGTAHAGLRQRKEAIQDFTQGIELDPKRADAYQRRGAEHFKQGQINESIADFDKFIELRPDQMQVHWQRGISYYYAGRFEEGWKQFKAYEEKDTNDVENAVWHYLCLARLVGAEKARASLLKIGRDPRVPLMEVYALFKGDAKPEDVLAAAKRGTPPPAERNQRLFYAHLYLGLYHESAGNKAKALEHMTKAAEDHKCPGYMWEVARVHLDRLRNLK